MPSVTGEVKSLAKEAHPVLGKALKSGDSVAISGFGSFKPVKRAARKGRNPRSGAEIQIPESTAVKFTPSKTLKESL